MDKRILKKIAKEWAKGILLATDLSSFDDDDGLDSDEQDFILNCLHEIANKITKENASGSLEQIINKYYDFN